jgi:hypothetical protein
MAVAAARPVIRPRSPRWRSEVSARRELPHQQLGRIPERHDVSDQAVHLVSAHADGRIAGTGRPKMVLQLCGVQQRGGRRSLDKLNNSHGPTPVGSPDVPLTSAPAHGSAKGIQ